MESGGRGGLEESDGRPSRFSEGSGRDLSRIGGWLDVVSSISESLLGEGFWSELSGRRYATVVITMKSIHWRVIHLGKYPISDSGSKVAEIRIVIKLNPSK